MTDASDKRLGDRIADLMLSLQVVRDALDGAHLGRMHQLIPLYGQLRALLSDRSKGNKPLLLDVSDQLGHPLYFFAMPGVDEPCQSPSLSPLSTMRASR
jgi:hypothetical protein